MFTEAILVLIRQASFGYVFNMLSVGEEWAQCQEGFPRQMLSLVCPVLWNMPPVSEDNPVSIQFPCPYSNGNERHLSN